MNTTNSKKTLVYRAAIVLAIGIAIPFGAMAVSPQNARDSKEPLHSPVELRLNDRPITREGRPGNSFSPVVKRVVPSVVKITTATSMKLTGGKGGQDLNNPWLRQFFGDGLQGPRQRMPRQEGMGSGVIVSRDGYILTNNHVIDGVDEVKVELQDGRDFSAKVIGRDPKTDVAVVKVEATDLPAIEVGSSDQLEVGDLVLAIGNPFGIGQTVTSGIISATGRATLGLEYEDFIQTDAAINPGNSGGALVDAEGRLIGINTAILSRSGGNQGIGFAIPISLARDVMDSLVKEGRVVRGYLGVVIQDVTPQLARKFKLKDNAGALVNDVVADGPAKASGIEVGDIVLEVNQKPVSNSQHLRLAVARVKPGETVPVRVLRDGTTKNLKVRVAELPSRDEATPQIGEVGKDEGTLNGVGVADLDPQTRREFRIAESVRSGAVVTSVEPDSSSAEAGLKPGDVILEINRTKVEGSADAVRLSEDPGDKTTLLKIWSRGRTRFLVVDETGK